MQIQAIPPTVGPLAETGRSANRNAGAEREAVLVKRLQDGDQLALAELYDQFGVFVYRVALGMVKHPATAEDLTQEIFLYVWNRIGGFDARRGSLAAWVGVVARSRSIDYLRSMQYRKARSAAPLEAAEGYPHPAAVRSGLTQVERVRLLQGPWMRMRLCERQALSLAYYSGFSQPEIAELLMRPLGTIKSWVRSGLMALRAELEGSGEL